MIKQDFPTLNTPVVDPATGLLNSTWQFFFLSLFNRTGGQGGNNSGSFLYPTSYGNPGQFLTSQGSSTSTIWTSPFTKVSQLVNDTGFITSAALSGYASNQSPSLNGTPLAPTAPVNTHTNQIATTAFVLNQGAQIPPLTIALKAVIGTSPTYARQDHQHPYNPIVTVGAATTITSGTGAPSGVQPNASLYLRSDGTTGTRLYVSNGASWSGVSGI